MSPLRLIPSDPPIPDDWYQPLLWPTGLAVLGILLYLWGARKDKFGDPRPFLSKFGPYLCGAGFCFGMLWVYRFSSDFLYRELIFSNRIQIAIFCAPVTGLVSSLYIGLREFFRGRVQSDRAFYNSLGNVHSRLDAIPKDARIGSEPRKMEFRGR